MGNVFVLGSLNIDLVIRSNVLPSRGETVIGDLFLITPGGKGGNQAVACAKQGIKTYMIGSLGDDLFSTTLEQDLKKYGVNCKYINKLENQNCGAASIWVVNGDNRIIINQGANLFHDINRIKSVLRSNASKDDILIAQLEIPSEIVEQTFIEAKVLGMKTILNPAPARKISDLLYRKTDLLIANESELQTLTGISPTDEQLIKTAFKQIISKGVKEVVLTYGDKGSFYMSAQKYEQTKAYEVDVIDTTAAGDTYIGVLVSEIINNSSICEAMKRGSAAAALTIQKIGAQISIPSKKEIDEFIRRYENEDHN